MQGIVVITGQRTGAGHLLSLLNNLPEVAIRDGDLGEHPDDLVAVLDRVELDALAHNQRVFIVKATSMLAREKLDADVLSRPGMRAVLVTRRLIDTYVSLIRARETGVWRDADTTGDKVTLDIDAFAHWLDEEALWFAHWQEWLRRRSLPIPILRYETHISMPPEAVLRRFTSAASQVGISLKVPASLPHPGLVQQDRDKAVAFKVGNWPEFSRGLIARDLEKRAFGYPI
jgi:hypothetical protein